MQLGTLILGIIIAALIFYFFDFQILLWCIGATIVIVIICFFYPIFRDEGKIPNLEKLPRKIWKKYVKWEAKFFKWINGDS